MKEKSVWFLKFLIFTFYIRIITFIIINLLLFYWLAELVVSDMKTFFYVFIPILAIIAFILVISYLNYYDIKAIKAKKIAAKNRVFLYLIYEGIALIVTAYKAPVLLLLGIFDIGLALIFKKEKYHKLFNNK